MGYSLTSQVPSHRKCDSAKIKNGSTASLRESFVAGDSDDRESGENKC